MSIHIRRIDKARDFMALGPLWNKLARESGQLSPFLSYDWFWCCWHGVWPKHRPEILLLEDAGTPVAIIPLMHWRERLRGLPVRCLGFLTYPNTPMADLLTVADHGLVVETFLDHLASRSDWDLVWLQRLPASSPTLKELEGTLPGRLPWRSAGKSFLPYLAIEAEWKNFCDVRDPSGKAAIGQIPDQFEHVGTLSIEEHRAADPWGPCLQEVIDILRADANGDIDVAGAMIRRMPEFFRELTRRATKNGWLSLWMLRLNGRTIALDYQIYSEGKTQTLWTADDPAYRRFSPGNTLTRAILQALLERGCVHEYSTSGSKDERPWWATGTHETVHIKLYRPGLYSRLLQRLEAADALGTRK